MKRYYFWDCALVLWLRKKFGIDKPVALEWGGWEEWKDKVKTDTPLAYFLTETVPMFLDDVHYNITEIYNKPRRYIRNRYFNKIHMLPTGLEPGLWWDDDSRLEGALIQLIIDHVEIQLAWQNMYGEKKFKWVKGRCPEAGLDYLDWASKLTYGEDMGYDPEHKSYGNLTHQALAAIEVQKLYDWCKNIRPNRPDPYEASGWSAYCDACRDNAKKHGTSKFASMFNHKYDTPEIKKMGDIARKKLTKIEKQNEKEDEEMFIRIVKIRHSLWT